METCNLCHGDRMIICENCIASKRRIQSGSSRRHHVARPKTAQLIEVVAPALPALPELPAPPKRPPPPLKNGPLPELRRVRRRSDLYRDLAALVAVAAQSAMLVA